MSHAAATFEMRSALADKDSVLSELVHDLRQPLSTIESVAYYLEIILPPNESKAREQVAKLQQLVEQSNELLNAALQREHAAAN